MKSEYHVSAVYVHPKCAKVLHWQIMQYVSILQYVTFFKRKIERKM